MRQPELEVETMMHRHYTSSLKDKYHSSRFRPFIWNEHMFFMHLYRHQLQG